MKLYLLGKLSPINYSMAIHIGSANERLASKAREIMRLPTSAIPIVYKKEFENLRNLIVETIKDLQEGMFIPRKINRIQNRTASKYLKLLLDVEKRNKN